MTQTLILAARPEQMTAAGSWGLPLAHLAYRVGGGPHLFRVNSPAVPRGGLMVMDAHRFDGAGESVPFCHEVLRECAARKFTGVVCRFGGKPQPVLGEICRRLGDLCAGRGLSCYVSEAYGAAAPAARVIIPTALSGGSLHSRLEEAQGRFGRDRVAVWADRAAEDFLLPSPSGAGAPLTAEELSRRKEEQGASVFFSDELCAHYFTYMAGEKAHFVLFDDAGSIRKKLRIARNLGVAEAFLPYETTADLLKELLERP
ncbi:MAG: hypothetical protein PUC36_02055 [Clostridiales bacterium]|nr:hypothetical protein [Clostridiales bacterium]